jgi:hypothetical protein
VQILAATKLNLQPEELNKIKTLSNTKEWNFLGYSLNLETGEFVDLLEKEANAVEMDVVTVLLRHYLEASPVAERGRLVKFEDLPGGHAYGKAFAQRAVQPLVEGFVKNSAALIKAGERLSGKQCNFGDVAVEVETLKGYRLCLCCGVKMSFQRQLMCFFMSLQAAICLRRTLQFWAS